MKSIFITFLIFTFNNSFAQVFSYDNNHQIIEVKYDNTNIVLIQYDANGNRINYSVSGGPLPVTLLSFNAQKSGEQVLLTWATSTEINTDKFDVEYSKDGNTFSSFISVAAKGNSSTRQEYSTNHCCPVEGVNYYRLMMIDRDGSFKYSEIKKVMFEFVNVMKVFPNPNRKNLNLNISFKNSFKKDGTISIYNTIGSLVYSSNFLKGQTSKQINTRAFATGNYYIVVNVDGTIYKEIFIKE